MPWIDKCLQSTGDFPVVVIDNASTDGTRSNIQNNYPKVTLLKQSINLGFGQANNIGIRYALDQGAEQFFLLNQDAYIIDDTLERLADFQMNQSEYGILSPVHTTATRTRLDKNFYDYMYKERTGQFYMDFVLGNKIASVYEIPFVNAASWLISKECLKTVGGFDPLFFHYGEDDNYCQRVIFHNFKIGIIPNTYIIHDREGRTNNKPFPFSEDYFKIKENYYKVKYANILTNHDIDTVIKKINRVIFKLILQFKIKRASHFQKELKILKKIKPRILMSRKINKAKGCHYI